MKRRESCIAARRPYWAPANAATAMQSTDIASVRSTSIYCFGVATNAAQTAANVRYGPIETVKKSSDREQTVYASTALGDSFYIRGQRPS